MSSNSFARPGGGGGGEGRGERGAPPEAIQACADLAIDDACEFEGRRGSVSGSCVIPSEDEEILACKPANHDSRSQSDRERR